MRADTGRCGPRRAAFARRRSDGSCSTGGGRRSKGFAENPRTLSSGPALLVGMTTATTPDALLTAAQAGDRAALERLLEQHRHGVYRYGLRVCRTTEDAEDA